MSWIPQTHGGENDYSIICTHKRVLYKYACRALLYYDIIYQLNQVVRIE